MMLTFNQSTSRVCVNIPVEDDGISEDPEDFVVMLTSEDPDVTFTMLTASVSITDDDGVSIGFEMERYTAREDQGAVEVCALVTKGSLARQVAIVLMTLDGSAENPEDYSNTSVTLFFDGSNTVECVNISLKNDEVLEGLEMFNVILDSGDEEMVSLSPNMAVIMIIDDDGKNLLTSKYLYAHEILFYLHFHSCSDRVCFDCLQRE